MYKVIKYFTDLHDMDHPYNVGDTFPREEIEVTQERVEELASGNNKQNTPLIEKVEDAETPTEESEVPVETTPTEQPKKTSAKRGESKTAGK
jgi:hypothetical protein